MPRGRPKTKMTLQKVAKTIDRKPIRPLERQRMRPWLMDLLDKDLCHQLVWLNKREKVFRIAWKHAAGQTFDASADATLFELWARHTGKYYTGDRADPKKWKANFRCALNSLQDVDEDKAQGVRKGNNAFKVYRFLDEKKVRKSQVKKEKVKANSDDEEDDQFEDEFVVLKNLGTRSRPRRLTNDGLESDGSEMGSSPAHYSLGWEASGACDLRRQDHETEADKSPLPNFDQLCEIPVFASPFTKSKLPDKCSTPEVMDTDNGTDELQSGLTDEEIVDTVSQLIGCQYLEEVQEAPEEVVGSNETFGPNVIVIQTDEYSNGLMDISNLHYSDL